MFNLLVNQDTLLLTAVCLLRPQFIQKVVKSSDQDRKVWQNNWTKDTKPEELEQTSLKFLLSRAVATSDAKLNQTDIQPIGESDEAGGWT